MDPIRIYSTFYVFQTSDKLGLSLELGSFAAGVMIATTDLGQHTLEQVRLFFTLLELVDKIAACSL